MKAKGNLFPAEPLEVGDKVKWFSYGKWWYGTVEKISDKEHGRGRPIKVRPKPEWKGQMPTLTSFKEKNLIKT